VDVLASFFNLLYSYRVRWRGEDKLWWPPPKDGCSMLDPSAESLFVMMTLPFVGRVFGGIRFFESGFFCLVGGPKEDPYHG